MRGEFPADHIGLPDWLVVSLELAGVPSAMAEREAAKTRRYARRVRLDLQRACKKGKRP